MRIALVIAGCLLMATPGCEMPLAAPAGPKVTPAMSDTAGRAMVRTEVVFGLMRDDGTAIDEDQWQQFADSAIATWFPAGFTIVDSVGRWRSSTGKIVQERSKVLILFHDGSEENLRKLDELRRLYAQRFGQQSVIRATGNVWVAF